MPLSKARDKERKRRERSVQPKSNLINQESVQPKLDKLKAVGLVLEGNTIVSAHKPVSRPSESVPVYNPSVHRAGDTVLVRHGNKLVTVTIPELDAGGEPIW